MISIAGISKNYANGYRALENVDLEIKRGEILALLGPNGAGKTTLISIVCGIVNASSGSVSVNGYDNVTDYRQTRRLIGLVPQELTLGAFDTVWNTLCFSRGLYGKKPDPALIEQILKDLALWEKRDSVLMALSGGMKRRVLIGKALAHEPEVLFLDEPTAGVDVELRKDMWRLVRRLRETGVTIILTTHYIEEAEEIADRVGIIDGGRLLLVEDKQTLMHQLGKKQLRIELEKPLREVPETLDAWELELANDGSCLEYTYDPRATITGVPDLLRALNNSSLPLKDIHTSQSSLEEIFVKLVKGS